MNLSLQRASIIYRAMKAEGEALGLNMGLLRGYMDGVVAGQIETARRIILHLGTKRLGEPDDAVVTTIEGIGDLETLEAIMDRLLSAESWRELLA